MAIFYWMLAILLLIESAIGGTITHSRVITKPNGDKITQTWTENTNDDADNTNTPNMAARSSFAHDFNQLPSIFRYVKPDDEQIKKAAVARGMDPASVDELLRTKAPVSQSRTDENGYIHTTTYSLEPTTGTISQRTLVEMPEKTPTRVINYSSSRTGINEWPNFEDLFKEPQEKHESEKPATPETPTQSQQPKNPTESQEPTIILPRTWQWKPFNSAENFKWRDFNENSPNEKNPNEKNPNEKNPNEKNTFESSVFENDPFESNPFEDNPFENKHFEENFNFRMPSSIGQPETEHNIADITTSTTVRPDLSIVNPNPMHTINLDSLPSLPASWQRSPVYKPPNFNWNNVHQIPEGNVQNTYTRVWNRQPSMQTHYPNMPNLLPTLPPTTKSTTTTTTQRPQTTTTASTPPEAIQPVKTLSIDDLPVTEILSNGTPVDEEFLKQLPEHMRPTADTFYNTRTIKIDNIPFTETTPAGPPGTKPILTFEGPPEVKQDVSDILNKSGITIDDLRANNGEPIVKTRIEPDGKIIRTTYRMRTVPVMGNAHSYSPIGSHPINTMGKTHKTQNAPNYGFVNSFPASTTQKTPAAGSSLISDFLAKHGITIDDVLGQRGQTMTKTIVDDDGRILTATFMLSAPIGAGGPVRPQQHQYVPIKRILV